MKQVMAPTQQAWVKSFLACALLAAVDTALAAGGLSSVENGLKDFLQSFYGIVAIVAGFALLGCGMMGMTGRQSWGEVIVNCGWVIFCAASLAIVKALWDWGKSVSL